MVSKVKEIMKRKKVTIQELAQQTGLATMTIERARGPLISECKLSTLKTIANALGVSVKKLFDERTEGEA